MKYAVLSLSGTSYKVSEGDLIKVNKLSQAPVAKVLFYKNDAEMSVGKPYLEDVSVKLNVEGEERGTKLSIRRFKAKSRYAKHTGFTPIYTLVRVVSISKKGEKTTEASEGKPKAAKKATQAVKSKTTTATKPKVAKAKVKKE